MSYKQFIQELEDDILPSEAERRCRMGTNSVFLEFVWHTCDLSFF